MQIDKLIAYDAPRAVRDRRDCVARAISVALQRPADEIATLLEANGRRRGCGTSLYVSWTVLESLGARRCHGGCTVSRFVTEHPSGAYVLFVRGHALAVVDGVVHDWPELAPRTRRIVFEYAEFA